MADARQSCPRVARVVLALVLAAAATACSHVVPIGQGPPAPCGGTRCAAGEYCCNASCGICAPTGATCIEIACGGPCDPQNVAADPACPSMRALGFAWNGAGCTLLSGCACIGEDCGALYPTLSACEMARAGCMPPPRPCLSASDCGPDELCDFPDDRVCGSTGTAGVCRARPSGCEGVFDPVCGCDGAMHPSACDAERLGVDLAFYGPCDPCAPEDAAPAAGGVCMSSLGEVWNGERCVEIFGCACSGVDCPLVMTSDCAMRHAGCLDPTTVSFDCVGMATCARWEEMCVVDPMGFGTCQPLPSSCPGDACACVMGGMCSDDTAGAVRVYL